MSREKGVYSWSEEDDQIVIELAQYPIETTLTRLSQPRTRRSVVRRRAHLGVSGDRVWRRWTPEEDALVLRPELGDSTIALSLDRSIGAVKKRRYHLRAKENR